MCRQIVGGRARRCGDHYSVADEFFKPHLPVDGNSNLRRLVGLTQKGHFIDGEGAERLSVLIDSLHLQWAHGFGNGFRDAFA